MHKAGKIVSIIFVVIILVYGAFHISYQKVVNDYSFMMNGWCDDIEPLVVAKQNAVLKFTEPALEGLDDEEVQVRKALAISSIHDLLEHYYPWMNTYKKYLKRNDFNLLVHPALKEVFRLEHEKYSADIKSNEVLLQYTSTFSNEDLAKFEESIKNMDQAASNLSRQVEIAENIDDYKAYFIDVPTIKCFSGYENRPAPFILFSEINRKPNDTHLISKN